MPSFSVQPSSSATRRFRTADYSWQRKTVGDFAGTRVYDFEPDFGTPSYIEVRWDQVKAVQNALWGMADAAARGLAMGTNMAAERVRDHLIQSVSDEITLPRDYIEEAVTITQEATEDDPTAKVSIEYIPEPLENFDPWQTKEGVSVIVSQLEGERRIPAAFVGDVHGEYGVFQREIRDTARVGRLPIEQKYGPSVHAIASEPGFMTRETQFARSELVRSIGEARDEIVNETRKTMGQVVAIGAGVGLLGVASILALTAGIPIAMKFGGFGSSGIASSLRSGTREPSIPIGNIAGRR